jgi:GNAT superfamily N-acetyltransferase
MQVRGPITHVAKDAERVLRTLPDWFGIEESLLEYARNADALPTFVAERAGCVVGFVSLREHFPNSWEIDCMAVEAGQRGAGVGKTLFAQAEAWLHARGASFLQVKTLAPAHSSQAYAQTRGFYEAVGFRPLEILPMLWGEGLPVLIYLKNVRGEAHGG